MRQAWRIRTVSTMRPADDAGVPQVAPGRLGEAGQHLLGDQRRVRGSGPAEQTASIGFDLAVEPPAGRDDHRGQSREDRHLDEDESCEHADHRGTSLQDGRGPPPTT